MSGYIPVADRTQAVLFPETLDEYVAAENPVRVIDAFVEGLDVSALGFARGTPAETGRPGYDPRALLKLYIYGYLNRVRSSRRLERETQRNVEVLWLLGRATPDHKTISDFRAAHGAALKGVFRQFTLVCRDLGLFGAELVGIDGSKFRAANGKDRSFTSSELRRLLKRIDARIGDYLAAVVAADHDDAAAAAETTSTAGLREKLAQLTRRQQAYEALLGQLDASGASQVTLTDPESRRMKVKEGTEVCYNAQIAVDAKHHLLAAAEVTNAETDVHQLSGMAAQAKDALAARQLTVVADAGYHNGPEVAHCVAAGITPLVPQPPNSQATRPGRVGRFPKEAFTYLPAEDAYRCPVGALLPFRFERLEEGQPQRFYYNNAACAGCALRPRCTGNRSARHGRRIQRWREEALLEVMAAQLRATPEAMRQRKALVEHPFGTIKRWHDGSYFLLRGLAKVRGEFSLMTLAYNLRRALAVVGARALLAAVRRLQRPRDALAAAC